MLENPQIILIFPQVSRKPASPKASRAVPKLTAFRGTLKGKDEQKYRKDA
jgi:hypothetical protein